MIKVPLFGNTASVSFRARTTCVRKCHCVRVRGTALHFKLGYLHVLNFIVTYYINFWVIGMHFRKPWVAKACWSIYLLQKSVWWMQTQVMVTWVILLLIAKRWRKLSCTKKFAANVEAWCSMWVMFEYRTALSLSQKFWLCLLKHLKNSSKYCRVVKAPPKAMACANSHFVL